MPHTLQTEIVVSMLVAVVVDHIHLPVLLQILSVLAELIRRNLVFLVNEVILLSHALSIQEWSQQARFL